MFIYHSLLHTINNHQTAMPTITVKTFSGIDVTCQKKTSQTFNIANTFTHHEKSTTE